MDQAFIKGMDISSYPEMLDKGYKYYDYDGNEVELIDFAVSQGFNYARLRIWNEPQKHPKAKGYCDLAHTKRMAQEIKKRGIGLLLDFHYSDWWADPGNQTKPEAWQKLDNDALTKAVYTFTRETLTELDMAGAYPDMVQIGNEIRCGMLWPEGKTDHWPLLAGFINAGIRAVRDTQKQRDTKVVLHLDQGGRYYYLEEWFDNCLANHVTDFDIIGLSYYAFWHGSYNDLKNSMEKLAQRYQRPLIIAEAAHGYRVIKGGLFDEPQERLAGFPASPAGQRAAMELVMGITANISGGKGLGIFYWEPFSMAGCDDGSWGSCMGLVDQKGRPMEGLKAFGENPYDMDAAGYVKLYAPEPVKLTEDQAAGFAEYLPWRIKALRLDGNIEKLPVSWEENITLRPGVNEIKGSCNGETLAVQILLAGEADSVNLAANSAFEDGFEGWRIERPDCVELQRREKIADEVSADEFPYLYIRGRDKFVFCLSRKIHVKRKGRYRFSLSFMGDNTTGVKVQMYMMADGVKADHAIFPEELWHEHSVSIEVADTDKNTDGTDIEIGFRMDSPVSYGAVRDIKVTYEKA
ncbi:MAG: arabinogalactan endo-1,4-beta-galactosidase [Muribaculaceae bacterium]|nr:arabinogalactan endo-1,4-beta-galactosidase [Roseburia sp.]MCM1432280.1 arabinogalactan endo-1,4-beta-galactosidase [Muribaculaceae bacterium]MCM1494056.1 arabinogalactan endo-1,4-beta-galactosidase [Muribaculaceae bacterium]